MKITIITSPFGYIPPNGIGAVEKCWYDIGSQFVKQGHDVCFISKTDRCNKNCDGLVEYGASHLFVKGYKRGVFLEDLMLDFIYSLKAMLKMKSCDILVMNTFWTPALCGFFRKKYKVSVYNVERIPKGQFFLYSGIDRFSCVSQAVKMVLAKQASNLVDKIKVISNPVNTEVYTYTERDRTEDKIILMYHGRIHPEKGLDILVKAYNSLLVAYDNLTLVLVGAVSKEMGGGGDEYRRYLESLTLRRIEFVDPVSDAKLLSKTVASCDIYCYPSIAENGETFGVAPLEAMALGRPVIVSDLDCFKDFVEDGVNGFVFNHREKGAAERLSFLIKQLIENEKLCKDIGCRAAKTAKGFSVANIANVYLQDFNQMLYDKNNR